MGELAIVVLVLATAATGGTKTGRAAVANALRSAHTATGWRTPGKALHHHAGRAGAGLGRLTAWTARRTRRLATAGATATAGGTARAARAGTGRMADRWQTRRDRDGHTVRPPIVWPARKTPAPDAVRVGPDVRPGTTPDAAVRQANPDTYRVSALPDGHPDQRHFALTVEQRGGGTWAVCRGPEVLTRDGEWELEPSPSNRDEAFLARARFNRDDALAAATREAPRIVVNDKTAADILARDARRNAKEAAAATAADDEPVPELPPLAKGARGYGVNRLPTGHPRFHAYEVIVAPQNDGTWLVRREPHILNRNGQWELQPASWEPFKTYEADARFRHATLDDALRAARRETRTMRVDGLTADERLARDAAAAPSTTDAPQTGPTSGPPNTGAAASGADDPPTAPPETAAPATTPHARDRAERSTPVRNRYTINLEMPSSDAEFLESCVMLGDVLRAIAEEIGEWANSLSGLSLPQSVIQPLDSISEGLTEAAGGAAQAAKSFEDEFEDAREVASRGMTITGQDAA